MAREKAASKRNLRRTLVENSSSQSSEQTPPSTASRKNAPVGAHPNGSMAESKHETSSSPARPSNDTASGTLFVVATPIGNAADISLRALEALQTVNVVACEDTRVTAKLFAKHSIHTPLSIYHEHNAEKARPRLIKRLKSGETVALVSDAGTPMVSDPGYKLVRACIDEGITVTPLPGPSSILTALILSGIPTDRFFFGGFLPQKKGGRQGTLREFASIPATLVLMESPRRLAASLADMAEILGPRDAAVCREMTKLFEEARRGTLPDLAESYRSEAAPKGEVVVVIGPPHERADLSEADIDTYLERALSRLSLRDAVREVADLSGQPRQTIYQRALLINDQRKSD